MTTEPMTLATAGERGVEYGKRLLGEQGLPTDVDREGVTLFVGRVGEQRVGVCGLEVRGSDALVRSVAVEPGERKKGYGAALIEGVVDRARERGVGELYLLTEDAAGFFETQGFERTEREAVPDAIGETSEFSTLCPASAVALSRDL